MNLLIVSNMAHYKREGSLVGWGAAAEEISSLAALFDEVRHVACLHPGEAPESFLPYTSGNVRLIPVRPSGGKTFSDKIRAFAAFPGYARVILAEIKNADAVHVRCPANISLLALFLLLMTGYRKKIWIKYAGSWGKYPGRPASYALQKWILKRMFAHAFVTINGMWPDQPPHVRSFHNPCLSRNQLAEAGMKASSKILCSPVRLLFAGRLEAAKGADCILEIARLLPAKGIKFRLDIAGDGVLRGSMETAARDLPEGAEIKVHGWIGRRRLFGLYETAHFVLLPSKTEGWPKVLSEGMAFGAVPLANKAGSIPEYLEAAGTGRSFGSAEPAAYAEALSDYSHHPDLWKKESERAAKASDVFTYEYFLKKLRVEWLEGGARGN
ncbi:MAG TPA: glycosyltransferase [Verrucomicrobiae bacterium]|nr:glycosyltransferase [Verrucomicrobiae bacterium]